jgi:hypothetical protein
MDPVRILAKIVDLLDNTLVQEQEMATSDDPEGDENEAEVRIGYGGRDLFDITIKRV